MSTAIYPPISPEDLIKEQAKSLSNEIAWLLESLQQTLSSLKEGLEECAALLAPKEPGSTLVLSTLRSESVKGFVTRVGTRIVKADIHLRLASLKPNAGATSYRVTFNPTSPSILVLPQLSDARNLINQSLDIVDVSTYTGDKTDARFIAGQLKLLHDYLVEARGKLKGPADSEEWFTMPVEDSLFDPPLPPSLSLHLSIQEAALMLATRTLEPVLHESPSSLNLNLNLRERLSHAIGASKRPDHDEVGEVFIFRKQEVHVKEKVRVDSQDPALLAVLAKLGALEHACALGRKALDAVLGVESE